MIVKVSFSEKHVFTVTARQNIHGVILLKFHPFFDRFVNFKALPFVECPQLTVFEIVNEDDGHCSSSNSYKVMCVDIQVVWIDMQLLGVERIDSGWNCS